MTDKYEAYCSKHGVIAEADTKDALIMKILKARTKDQCWHVVQVRAIKHNPIFCNDDYCKNAECIKLKHEATDRTLRRKYKEITGVDIQ